MGHVQEKEEGTDIYLALTPNANDTALVTLVLSDLGDQIESDFGDLPQELFSSIIKSNISRKKYIAHYVASLDKKVIGIYLLAMKKNSDNFRESSIVDVIQALKELDKNITILIYEPLVNLTSMFDCEVVSSLEFFKQKSEIILANRPDASLDDVKEKVFTRDIYGIN